ncbi:MAG: hypothetical protein LBP87_16085 [Planctomycetaceae bacterium]|jgi:hypothetical protein|nr:hypothetical protein [Planctomycetaceae bacterium]
MTKKFVLTALFSAVLVVSFTTSAFAGHLHHAKPAPTPVVNPRTPVANLNYQNDPQPATAASLVIPDLNDTVEPDQFKTLNANGNRLIRWQSWLYRDAFSVSVLTQLQQGIKDKKIDLGITANTKEVADKLAEILAKDPNAKLVSIDTSKFELALWLYRHNHSDSGLYQLIVDGSVLLKVETLLPRDETYKKVYWDIQALDYEFGDDISADKSGFVRRVGEFPVTLFRGAVVAVDEEGVVTNVAGSIAGVQSTGGEGVETVGNRAKHTANNLVAVNKAPFAEWEYCPKLPNGNYNPANDLDRPKYIHPNDRSFDFAKNSDAAPEVQSAKPRKNDLGYPQKPRRAFKIFGGR